MAQDTSSINCNIFRYNFSETIMQHIAYFAKLHQFEDRHTYKENWNRWYEEYHISLDEEIIRLKALGYKGDIQGKMFKAGRYYFRKKANNSNDNEKSDNTDNQPQSKYTMMSKTILDEMTTHIITSMQNDKAYTPAKGYIDFCERYAAQLEIETERLKLGKHIAEEDLSKKIKKTYKNRYFIVTKS